MGWAVTIPFPGKILATLSCIVDEFNVMFYCQRVQLYFVCSTCGEIKYNERLNESK